ncbi:hypothetical protein SGFS_022930 [Streptomyces graminofaciens]|uniref:Peptidase M61 catalytic domain-containing protein n=1 Tax=Streptomyces graminofaciens TaxID=68212 RepID=A0ABM7F5Q0_9ACTN|nr:hypothetical protein [Streptomyces graminofaciens]BBC30999.1 hypothetical protein SGFS_022930 [Streptomyces graminofaciens]
MCRPTLRVTLTPCLAGNAASGVRVTYAIGGLRFAAGQALCKLPEVLFGVEAAKVASDGIRATDDLGVIPLTHTLDDPTPSFTYRRWTVQRDTRGDVTVDYVAPVRIVDATTANGPLFDLRAEGAGISGAGISFLALPELEATFDTEVRWDLKELPSEARGVSSHGEGTVRRTTTLESVACTFFMAGVLHSHPPEPHPTFGMFWLSPPTFDAALIGRQSRILYEEMCRFFREPAPGFRVFVRKHPYRGLGGSLLPGSRGYMFGWSDSETHTIEELTRLLAHETVHNWPLLDGWEDPSQVSWYNEGVAEYYSIFLPHRVGLISDEAFLDSLNQRARGYYGNPLQTLTSAEAAELYWKDWRAQRVPYGRGLFHLIDMDHRIRQATHGTRSLDDVVLALLERKRAGHKATLEDWTTLVTQEVGDAARTAHEAMMSGEWILPDLDCLMPYFQAKEVEIHQLDVGFDYSSFKAGIVSGIVHSGPAAKAGVREGDTIVHAPPPERINAGRLTDISLTLRRGSDLVDVTYEPLGRQVKGMVWQNGAVS